MKGVYVILTTGQKIGPIMHYDDPDRVMGQIKKDPAALFEIDLHYNGCVGEETVSFNPDHVVRVIKYQ